MRLVIVESPYAGDVKRNIRYCRAALLDCLRRGEAPFASALLYAHPEVLNDSDPTQRSAGIAAGLAWGRCADATVVYIDLGISNGMEAGIANAVAHRRPVERRTLLGWSR